MDNSDTAVPTERAVRSAIQSQICPPAFAHIEDTSAGEDEFASYDECYPATYVPSGTPASYGSAGTVLRALHAWD